MGLFGNILDIVLDETEEFAEDVIEAPGKILDSADRILDKIF